MRKIAIGVHGIGVEWKVLHLTNTFQKYREVILKLDGLDDFQRVWDFIRGLDKDFQAKVKTQYPKTLEDAIKSALIFDDALDRKGALKTSESHKTNVASSQSKRKF